MPDRSKPGTPSNPTDDTLLRGGLDSQSLSTDELQRSWSPLPGDADELSARYVLGRLLGAGGMAEVHAATDVRLRREVAVKTLPRGRRDGAFLSRFVKEAQLTGSLAHPNIPPVHDIGIGPDGTVFFSMQVIHGRTLTDIIKAGEFPRSRRLEVFAKVCDAVGYAHALGVLHRDLKPSNIMVGQHGQVYVVDWGIAVRIGHRDVPEAEQELGPRLDTADLADERLTRDGDIIGTPAFMAPEQIRGKLLDERTDVYALGVLLYTLICDRPPFSGPTTTERVLTGSFEAPTRVAPNVPWELEQVVLRAMSMAAGQRYASAEALAADVKAYQAGEVLTGLSYPPMRRLARYASRNWTAFVGGAGVLIASALVVVAFLATNLFLVSVERGHTDEARVRALVASGRAAHAAGDGLGARAQLRTALAARDSLAARALWWELSHDPIVWRREVAWYPHLLGSDGEHVLLASEDDQARLLDTQTSEITTRFLGGGALSQIRRSASLIIAADFDGRVTGFDATSWAPLWSHTIEAEGAYWVRVFAAPDHGLIAAELPDRLAITRVDAQGATPVVDLPAGSKLGVTSNMKVLVSAPPSGSVERYDLNGDRRVLAPAIAEPVSVELTDHAAIVVGSTQILTVPLRGGKPRVVPRFSGHIVETWMDGDLLLAVVDDGRLVWWDINQARVARELHLDLGGEVLRAAPLTGQRALLALYNSVVVVDTSVGTESAVNGHTGPIEWVAPHPTQPRFVTASADGTAQVWSADGGDPLRLPLDGVGNTASWDESGERVATGTAAGTVNLWDANAGTRLLSLALDSDVTGVGLHSDALYTVQREGALRRWDLVSTAGVLATSPSWHRALGSGAWSAALPPNGRFVVAATESGRIHVTNATGTALAELTAPESHTATMSADGSWLLTSGFKGTAILRSMPDGRVAETWPLDGWSRGGLSADGRRLVLPRAGHTVVIDRDASTERRLRGRPSATRSAAILSDGRIVTAGASGAVQVWDPVSLLPQWRTVLATDTPAALLTHAGWADIGPTSLLSDTLSGAWAADAESDRVCRLTADTVDYLVAGVLQSSVAAPEAVAVALLADGCATLRPGGIDTPAGAIEGPFTNVSRSPGGVVAVAPNHITILGATRRDIEVQGATAAWVHTDGLVLVGHTDGTVTEVGPTGAPTESHPMKLGSSLAVAALSLGPQGTVFVADDRGTVYLLERATGTELLRRRLRGRPTKILHLDNGWLAVSETGDYALLDLSVFDERRCDLLADVDARVAVRWIDGRMQSDPAPSSCD